jgi:DNA repair protein RadC
MATHNYTSAQQSVISEALNLVQERAATEGDFMTSPSMTFDYFRLFYAGKQEREHFALMLLDSQHKVLECNVIFSGTIDGAAIYPREVAKVALYANAAAVILAHNHPSGQPVHGELLILQYYQIVSYCRFRSSTLLSDRMKGVI